MITKLTSHQLKVAQLIAKDMTTAQIAARLDCAERTITHCITRIFRKLGVGSRVGVAVYIVKSGLELVEGSEGER